MNVKPRVLAALAFGVLAACASQRDNFYTLNSLPAAAPAQAAAPAVHVLLNVAIPSLVDRAEMVVSTSESAVMVLDHERWVSSLSDQVYQTLARDLEQRRGDVLVGDRGFDQKTMASVLMRIDIVRMSAKSGGIASIEAHWRIQDEAAGTDEVGSGVFDAPLAGAAYDSIAKGYSQALGALAEKLVAGIRTPLHAVHE